MLLVKKITNTIKLFIIVIFITFSLSLLIDFFLGKLILKSLDPYLSKTNFYERLIRIDHKFYHHTLRENIKYSSDELVTFWENICNKFPIVSIEDPFDENDWNGFKELTKRIGKKVQIVGDDLFVTNKKRLLKGINNKSANSILIKLNQIGTLSETLETMELAKDSNFGVIVSHRSGETEDVFISDLSVALNARRCSLAIGPLPTRATLIFLSRFSIR